MSGLRELVERGRRRLSEDSEQGTTMMEMVVTMAILGIFLAIFTGAMLVISSTVTKVDAISQSNAQVNQAFMSLDKKIRYASAITTPAVSNGSWYVEYDTTNTATEVCTQLRINTATQVLQQRSWTVPASGTPTATSWTAIASLVTNGGVAAGNADQPFTFPAALSSATSPFQRLTIVLVTRAGNNNPSTTRSVMTFTALNSNSALSTNGAKCQQLGRP